MSETNIPHDPNASHAVPKKKKNGCLIAAIIAGVAGLLLIGGCAALTMFGLGQVNKMVASQIQANPEANEYFGEITKAKMDIAKTGERAEDNILAMRVEGSKANGWAFVRTDESSQSFDIVSITNDSGEEIYSNNDGASAPAPAQVPEGELTPVPVN